MSNVNRIDTGSFAAGRLDRLIEPAARHPLPTEGNTVRRNTVDSVDLSSAARHLEQQHGESTVRQNLVQRVRASIEAGTYETPQRLDQAARALLQELEG